MIVLSDVIEHLDSPGIAIRNLAGHLNPGGKLIITTPNLTHYGLLIRAISGGNLSVYYDHVAGFLPEHVQALCNRFGYRLSAVYFFGHIDRRTFGNLVKSSLSRLLGRLSMRLNSSFAAVIEGDAERDDDRRKR